MEKFSYTDVSEDTLKELLADGYSTVKWMSNLRPGLDEVCRRLNGKVWKLDQFLKETKYSAPIFSHGHVNCKAHLVVTGPNLTPVKVYGWDWKNMGFLNINKR